jgi:Protein of unknown function (DUF1488)
LRSDITESAPVTPRRSELVGPSWTGLGSSSRRQPASASVRCAITKRNERGGEVAGLKAIRRALENRDVLFLPSEGDAGPGVRLVARVPNVLRRPTKLGKWDALMISVEWRGLEVEIFVPQAVLDDLERFRQTRPEAEYVGLFDKHRAAILKAAARAIDAGRVAPDRRVHLRHEDFGDRP